MLVHEVAHHVDHTTRVARGRWRADEERKVEEYADTRMLEWTRGIVLPYLEERYPDEVERLLGWIERHGGVRLSLETVADDPTDVMAHFFPCSAAVHELMKCVLEEMDPFDVRVEFAEELWLCDLHDELETVPGRHPRAGAGGPARAADEERPAPRPQADGRGGSARPAADRRGAR